MSFCTLLGSLRSRPAGTSARGTPRRPKAARLHLEALDDRTLPSTFTVTNLLDAGTGSLRAAVAAANSNPGADTIDFGVTGTIVLTSGQLDITDSVTIDGPGAGSLTVSGNYTWRVFRITGDPTVVIADLTVANGIAVGATGDPAVAGNGGDGLGGGLYVAGGTLTLERCVVSGNSAAGGAGATFYGSGGAAAGGGLYVAGGAVYVNQSAVSGNGASGGGGGEGYYYLDIGGYGGAAAGGGIYVGAGTVQLYQSTLSGNYAVGGYGGPATFPGLPGEGEGGGLYVGGGTVTLDQSTVSGNYALGGSGAAESSGGYAGNGGAAAGGGIRVAAGTVQLYQSSLSGNTADGGSGGWSGSYQVYWPDGVGVGGGLSIATAAPALVADLDTYTEANTINNSADVDPNISGPYSLNGAFVRTLVVHDVTTPEGNTGTRTVSFAVNLNAASNQTITVDYATADGTAVSGSDYQPTSGTLTFSPGETTKTVTVQVIGDRLAEANESFFINLSSPTNAVITDGQGVGTVADDEPRISISNVSKAEGKNRSTTLFTFTVTLSAAYDQPVTVSYRTVDGTATTGDGDYAAKTGTLTFAPGETTKTVTIEVRGDNRKESNETFYLDLFDNNSNSLFTRNRGIGTTLNDD